MNMINIDLFANIVWIIGMCFILVGYFLIQTDRIKANTLKFITINFIGSLLLLYSLTVHFNLASFVLECIYISISLYWYYRYFTSK